MNPPSDSPPNINERRSRRWDSPKVTAPLPLSIHDLALGVHHFTFFLKTPNALLINVFSLIYSPCFPLVPSQLKHYVLRSPTVFTPLTALGRRRTFPPQHPLCPFTHHLHQFIQFKQNVHNLGFIRSTELPPWLAKSPDIYPESISPSICRCSTRTSRT